MDLPVDTRLKAATSVTGLIKEAVSTRTLQHRTTSKPTASQTQWRGKRRQRYPDLWLSIKRHPLL